MASRKKRSNTAALYREFRAATARGLKQAKSSGVVLAARPLVNDSDCRVCQAVRSRAFPIEDCTVDMLPPYKDCELEDGCRASVTFVVDVPDEPGRGLFGWLRSLVGK